MRRYTESRLFDQFKRAFNKSQDILEILNEEFMVPYLGAKPRDITEECVDRMEEAAELLRQVTFKLHFVWSTGP
jgi:hypothetical protein